MKLTCNSSTNILTNLYRIIAITLCSLLISQQVLADDNNTINANVDIPVSEINNFARVYAIAKNYYFESISDKKLMDGAINGMLSNLDPHSNYLDKSDFAQLTEMTSGAFAGVGIEVGRETANGGIKVIAPLDDTPAFKAGIKSGDVIIKIDNTPVDGLSLDEAVKMMRGKSGSSVRLTISRANQLKPLIFNISRATIEVQSVKYTMIAPHYAYVRISAFQTDTVNNLVYVLQQIYHTDPHLKGLILDLRDNPGGILQAAVGVVACFVPQDSLVVYTKGRAPDVSQKFFAALQYYTLSNTTPNVATAVPAVFHNLPMIVMVNQGTASAAEIVSGALQDYKRAKIIGVTTFGKGSVQTVIPLAADIAVKLTTALYYTPKGRSIQAQGIKPDIIVKSEYSDLYDSWGLTEASLDHHVSNPNTIQVTRDESNVPVITPSKQIQTQSELTNKIKQQLLNQPKIVHKYVATINLANDFQLQWGLNILEGKPLPAITSKHVTRSTTQHKHSLR